jgi:hypothetical protein
MTFVIRGAGRIAVILSALIVLGLAMGPAAAAGTAQAGDQAAMHGHTPGFHFAANSSHPHTGAGFNLTANKTTGPLKKNATAGSVGSRSGGMGRAGNLTHEKKASGFAGNATMQQERLQKLVTGLQQKGVNVSALQTAIANNDTAAEKAWFVTYMQSHKGQVQNQTAVHKAPGFAGNATMQQERIQKLVTGLQQKGVDVSALQTAIANNDTAAEKAWFASYYQAHKEQITNTTRQQWHPGNATASRSA